MVSIHNHNFFYNIMKKESFQDDTDRINPYDSSDFVIVILRHMSKENHKILWKRCYDSVSHFYNPDQIYVIDDNSSLIDENDSIILQNHLLHSEYKGAGEILPYYYFLKHKWAKKMAFLHDSMFMVRPFEDSELRYKVIPIWHFSTHSNDEITIEPYLLEKLINHTELLLEYKKRIWNGCFGAATIISLEAVENIEKKYNAVTILPTVLHNRKDRMALERIWGLLLYVENNISHTSLYGDIRKHPYAFKNSIPYQLYEERCTVHAICKTWSGR